MYCYGEDCDFYREHGNIVIKNAQLKRALQRILNLQIGDSGAWVSMALRIAKEALEGEK